MVNEISNCLRHISKNSTDDEKAGRLSTLTDTEKEAYKWLLAGYSERWTTETLGLERSEARTLFQSVYRKLVVENTREIIHCYMSPADANVNNLLTVRHSAAAKVMDRISRVQGSNELTKPSAEAVL